MGNYKDLKIDIKYIDVNLLEPDLDNPKIHTEAQIKNVRKTIKEYGFVMPLGISDDYKIKKGNCAYQAALLEGYVKLPCVFWSHLTEQQQEALSILDNELTLQTNFDAAKLNMKLEHFNLDLSGFGLATLDIDSDILADLKTNNFTNMLKNNSSIFSISFDFDKLYQEQIMNYIREKGKKYLVNLIIDEVCRSVEVN